MKEKIENESGKVEKESYMVCRNEFCLSLLSRLPLRIENVMSGAVADRPVYYVYVCVCGCTDITESVYREDRQRHEQF